MTTLPPSLVRFRSELVTAVARDRRPRRRRTLARRLAMVATATATAVLAVAAANVVTGRGPSVVDRAAAALSQSRDGIFHLRIVSRENGSGESSTWTNESWVSTSAPYAERNVQTGPSGRVETESSNGVLRIYDAATNTIYEGAAKPARPVAGTAKQGGTPSKPEAKDDASTSEKAAAGKPAPAEPSRDSAPWDAKFRDSVLAMLRSGDVREDGHTFVDGREAIRIVLTEGEWTSTYLVDAASYDPVEWRMSGSWGSSTLRFEAYETLEPSAANRALLSIAAQHPGANVNDDPGAYLEYVGRLSVPR